MFNLCSVMVLERFMLSCTLEHEGFKRSEKNQNGKVIMFCIRRLTCVIGHKTTVEPCVFKLITYI
jgi:hypothetical protein